MKPARPFVILFALFSCLSVSAFADPFEAFDGRYVPTGAPTITADQTKECNWANFRGMTEVSITKDGEGAQFLSIVSLLNNSPTTIGYGLKEFSSSGPFGVSNTGKIDGGPDWARYQQVNSTPDSREILTWEISRRDSSYAFQMTYQIHDQFGVNGACYYSVPMKKE